MHKVTMVSYKKFMDMLDQLPKQYSTLVIGIDGHGAAGKSMFSDSVRQLSQRVTVVHMDDFYKPSSLRERSDSSIGAAFDWERLVTQVLNKLMGNQSARYQRYDWETDSLAEWHTVPAGEIVLIEGIYSTRKELRQFYDLLIWIECPHEIRLARGIERDGEKAREAWVNDWMPAEDRYVQNHRPDHHAHLLLDGCLLDTQHFCCKHIDPLICPTLAT
jgi:uridine kinase